MNQPNYLYGTHLPMLVKVVDLTTGPVLELGMGLYSSPFLHMMCEIQKRQLISIDSDKKWFAQNQRMRTTYHEVYFAESWDELEKFVFPFKFSVALVDEKPAKHRKESIKILADKADFVVIHDTEPESDLYFKYRWVKKLYKYHYRYEKLRPYTSVWSNFIDVEKLFNEKT